MDKTNTQDQLVKALQQAEVTLYEIGYLFYHLGWDEGKVKMFIDAIRNRPNCENIFTEKVMAGYAQAFKDRKLSHDPQYHAENG